MERIDYRNAHMLRLNNVDSNVEMMIKAVIIVLAVAVQRHGREK